MGNGTYGIVTFGGIVDYDLLPEELKQGEDMVDSSEVIYELAHDVGCKTSYECEDRWVGVPLVDITGTYFNSGDEDIPQQSYFAVPFSEFNARMMASVAPDKLKESRKKYNTFRRKVKKAFNVQLPPGTLMIVFDYD